MRLKILFSFFLVILFSFMSGCKMSSSPQKQSYPEVPASSFLADLSSFPEGWSSTFCDSSLCEEDQGISSAGQDYFKAGVPGHAYEEVYRLSDDKEASRLYSSYKNGEFNESSVRQPFVPFEPPAEITFKSKLADESYFACGVDVNPQCKYLARFRNYFIYFYFAHSTEKRSEKLSYSEIQNVLEAVEMKVGQFMKPQKD